MEYDEFFALSRRQYVPPNFAELRHILNIAQVRPLGYCAGGGSVLRAAPEPGCRRRPGLGGDCSADQRG